MRLALQLPDDVDKAPVAALDDLARRVRQNIVLACAMGSARRFSSPHRWKEPGYARQLTTPRNGCDSKRAAPARVGFQVTLPFSCYHTLLRDLSFSCSTFSSFCALAFTFALT